MTFGSVCRAKRKKGKTSQSLAIWPVLCLASEPARRLPGAREWSRYEVFAPRFSERQIPKIHDAIPHAEKMMIAVELTHVDGHALLASGQVDHGPETAGRFASKGVPAKCRSGFIALKVSRLLPHRCDGFFGKPLNFKLR